MKKSVLGLIVLIILLVIGALLFTIRVPVYTYNISTQQDQPGATETSVPPNFSIYINPQTQVHVQDASSTLDFDETGSNLNVTSPFYALVSSAALSGEVILSGSLNTSGSIPLLSALSQYGPTAKGNASLSSHGATFQSADGSTTVSLSSLNVQTGLTPSSDASLFTIEASAMGAVVESQSYDLSFSSGTASGNMQAGYEIYSLLSSAMSDNNGTIPKGALDNALSLLNGTLSLSLQGVTFSTPDNATRIQASSLSGEITLAQTYNAGEYQISLNWHMTGVQIHSSKYSGRVSSISLSGTISHDTTNDQTTGSIYASVAPGSIILGFLGL